MFVGSLSSAITWRIMEHGLSYPFLVPQYKNPTPLLRSLKITTFIWIRKLDTTFKRTSGALGDGVEETFPGRKMVSLRALLGRVKDFGAPHTEGGVAI